MRRWMASLAFLSLAACQQPEEAKPAEPEALQKAQAEIQRLKMENADLLAQKPKAKPTAQNAYVSSEQPMDSYDAEDRNAADKIEADYRRKLCWQDYCPCESSETALDTIICRNARGGIEMSDDQWAIGAQARDSKRAGDRLNQEMDDIISDTRPSRY